jgi:hypothetical protein
VRDRLLNGGDQKHQRFSGVLRDTWDAPKDRRLLIESLPQVSSCPIKDPPQGDDWGERAPLGGDGLAGSAHEWAQGKGMKIKGYPKEHKERCFRGEVSPHGAEGVVTNARVQRWREATQSVGGLRGTIEPWPRGGKPVTGREGCPCRQAGIQGHHSGCAFLVRVRLKELATPMGRRSINSNRGGWMITSLSNSRIRLSRWFLPKPY